MAGGSLLIYQEFRERRDTLIGFSLMALAGFGTILVGLFPENTIPRLHIIGASLPFVLGNISLIVLGLAIFSFSKVWRLYTVASGVIPLLALFFFVSQHYLGLGIGSMERVVAYPQTVWLIFFGLYMMRSHYLNGAKLKLRS